MSRKKRRYGLSFSWKRAVGLSQRKQKIARKIGIPLTRAGRQRKVGALVLGAFLGRRARRKKRSR